MKIFLGSLILIIFFSFLFISIGIFMPIQQNSEEVSDFLIERGDGVNEISIKLKRQELVRWSFLFEIYILIRGEEKNLKAGNYSFSKSMSLAEISEKIISGDTIKEKIAIIEGWNLRDIGWYFENKGMFLAEELFELVGFPVQNFQGKFLGTKKFDFLTDKPNNVNLEGYLFPDTYEISPEANLEEIILIMLSNFNKKLTLNLRKEIKSQNKTIFEIITIASLLEKEVRTLEDKKIVSGILRERLKLGVPLQIDATISYITGKKTVKISKKETEINSLYNTYKYRGLPFGPISNPGIESIKAAIYPKDTPYFYYLSTPEGETIFSRTLEEHNFAKAKYLK